MLLLHVRRQALHLCRTFRFIRDSTKCQGWPINQHNWLEIFCRRVNPNISSVGYSWRPRAVTVFQPRLQFQSAAIMAPFIRRISIRNPSTCPLSATYPDPILSVGDYELYDEPYDVQIAEKRSFGLCIAVVKPPSPLR